MNPLVKRLSLLSLASAGLFCSAAPGQAWDPEIVDLFSRIPVQDGGRVKPLESLASFTLLGMHGKRSLTTLQDETLTPMEWLLDTMFRPEEAQHHPLFKVVDSETIEAIGVSTAGKRKADRYSYIELQPGIDRLFNLAAQHNQKEANQRTRVEGQLLNLATNVGIFQRLQASMQFARHHFNAPTPRLQELFGGRDHVHFSDLVERGPALFSLYQNLSAASTTDPERNAVEQLIQQMDQHMRMAEYLALFPPEASAEEAPEWRTALELGVASWTSGVSQRDVEILRGFEQLLDAQDPREFKQLLVPLSESLIAGAERRGEYETIDLEVTYYRMGLTHWALGLYFIGLLFVMLTWLMPKVRLLYHGGWTVTLAATLALSWAIVLRCIIRERPPVSTLYETMLFITAVVVLVALIAEWITKRKIALSVGAVLGVVGMFLSNRFEGLDGVPRDTMPTLQAVLDTNFWLATHVTAITIGYAAGMLAAGIGSFYLLAKVSGWQKGNKSLYKGIARMTYGVVCFGLLFSVVGTILGGIWANDSWGRFWGWDPKENGALLICLMNLAILHGRMGGYLRDHGVCTAAAFGGTVVAFSWFHVNQLGVGLHSYGFTEGVLTGLYWYYSIQGGIIALGFVPWLMARHEERIKREVEERAKELAAADRAGGATA